MHRKKIYNFGEFSQIIRIVSLYFLFETACRKRNVKYIIIFLNTPSVTIFRPCDQRS